MFGKLMNNYYYGKSGKGDYTPDDLPKNRWQLFWEMLRVRFSGLMRLNLMYAVVWLPAMILMLMTFFSILNVANAEDPSSVAGLDSLIYTGLLILVPCIAITGPCTAGVAYVTRNWARDEHAFIWADFKDAVKANWKQALPTSIITGLMPLVCYVGWTFYRAYAQQNAIMMIPQFLLLMIGILFSLCISYAYPLMVTYQLRYRDLVRNSVLLGIGRLPISAAMRALHCVPVLIAFGAALLWNPVLVAIILFAYYLLLGFALSRFITASFTNAVFDKVLNPRIPGTQINRGLNTNPDDDDEDEDEEEPEA